MGGILVSHCMYFCHIFLFLWPRKSMMMTVLEKRELGNPEPRSQGQPQPEYFALANTGGRTRTIQLDSNEAALVARAKERNGNVTAVRKVETPNHGSPRTEL
jgi:hypothetical protein